MLDAAKAKELSLEHGKKRQTNLQELDAFIYENCKLGFQNCTLDIPMEVAGAMMQDLINRGFVVHGTINSNKEICEIDLEWF